MFQWETFAGLWKEGYVTFSEKIFISTNNCFLWSKEAIEQLCLADTF